MQPAFYLSGNDWEIQFHKGRNDDLCGEQDVFASY